MPGALFCPFPNTFKTPFLNFWTFCPKVLWLVDGFHIQFFNSSTVSLSLTLALHRFFTYFSMSKAFLSSKSDRSRYCLCFVMSNLLEKNGLTPLSCMIHFPPSITEISSIDINSLTHCQVKNSFLLLFHTRNLVDVL